MLSEISEPTVALLDDFRLFLNDYVIMNRLLKTEESPSGHLSLALRLACDDYNNTPPLIPKVLIPESFPNTNMLFHGGAIIVFKQVGLMHLRNQLSYNDGGISVQINEKEGQYRQWYQDYRAEYQRWIEQYKTSRNYEGFFGNLGSEYALGRYVW